MTNRLQESNRTINVLLIKIWIAACLVLSLPYAAIAQTDVHLKFDVASVKPTGADVSGSWYEFPPGGRFNVVNNTLKSMIEFAWDLQPFQISGGPPWLDSIHYDINAKSEIVPKMEEIGPMLQALLTERFHLAIHRDTKELPIYALVVARKDAKLGPGLTESKKGSCTTFDPSGPRIQSEPGIPPKPFCGTVSQNPRALGGVGVPITKLIPMLSATLGRQVVDKTGLTGNFDVHMQWTPDETQVMQFPSDLPKPPPPEREGQSIFIAIQEQLGLKLEASRGPVEVLIIDRAEKPSEN